MFLVPGSGISANVEDLIAIARKIADRALRLAGSMSIRSG